MFWQGNQVRHRVVLGRERLGLRDDTSLVVEVHFDISVDTIGGLRILKGLQGHRPENVHGERLPFQSSLAWRPDAYRHRDSSWMDWWRER